MVYILLSLSSIFIQIQAKASAERTGNHVPEFGYAEPTPAFVEQI